MKKIIGIFLFMLMFSLSSCNQDNYTQTSSGNNYEYYSFENYMKQAINLQDDNINSNITAFTYDKISFLIFDLGSIESDCKYTIHYYSSQFYKYETFRTSVYSSSGDIMQIDSYVSDNVISEYTFSYHNNIISIQDDNDTLAYVYFKNEVDKDTFSKYVPKLKSIIYKIE